MEKEGKLLMISSDFPPVPGGQSRFLYDLWSCLPGEEIVVLAPQVEGADAVDSGLDCRVVRIPLPLEGGRWSRVRKAFRLLGAALRIVREERIRGLHCGQVFSAGFAGYGCRMLKGIPYYPYVHGADLLEYQSRFPWSFLLRRILGRAEKVIVNSRFTRSAVQECGVSLDRIEIFHPAIDLARFSGGQDREQTRRQRGWEGKKVILTIGRLVERKGQDRIIQVLPRVAAQVPEVHYAVVGDGPHRRTLEDMTVRRGVQERVSFLGFVAEEDLPGLYAGADLFAMVSRQIPEKGEVEGFGIVYLEANAAGLAVVGGRSGGVEDAVVHGQTGLLVDPEDEGELARTLVRLLKDDDLRGRLGRQGQERVRREFDRRRQAARLWERCA